MRLSYTEYDFMQFDSGRIVMFDAYSSAHAYKPFDAECGVVAFPFYCGCKTDKGERVAYAGLRFCEDKPVSWKPLRLPYDARTVTFNSDEGGIPISSGVCCFSDEAAYEKYRGSINDDVHPLAGHIVLDGQTHERVEIDGHAYAVFSSGWGDGIYNCYCGVAEDGRITAIIADFGMIEYPPENYERVETEVEVPDGMYIYDPAKTEAQNHVEMWTRALEAASGPLEKLRALSRRGYAYHSMNDTDKALDDYVAAVECCKNVGDRGELMQAWSVYDNAAEIYCERSDYDAAEKIMLEALAVGDNFYAGAYVRLIDIYMQTKRTDSALEIAKRMLSSRPEDPVALIKYAECCVSALDYGSAAWAYDKLATEFRLYENLFDEASCFIELGEYDKAKGALSRHPAGESYEQYWYYLAYMEFKRVRLFSALALAERAYAMDSEYMPALYLLIDINLLLCSYHDVARYAEEYKRLRPENEYGYSVCADAHLALGIISESAKNYCYLYQSIKQDDKYAALAAITCAATGDGKRANKMLRALRKKRSEYYYGVLYAFYVIKYDTRRKDDAEKLLMPVSDVDFLTQLSVFLFATGHVTHSSRILESLGRTTEPNSDIIAHQIRTAERVDNQKLFMSFLNYYVQTFVDGNATADDRKKIAERFINDKRHKSWLEQIV